MQKEQNSLCINYKNSNTDETLNVAELSSRVSSVVFTVSVGGLSILI